jgi:thiol-disulfide isomerase/thioredoxin
MNASKGIFTLFFSLIFFSSFAHQPIQNGPWRGNLVRTDGKVIAFHFDVRTEKNKTVLYIINANERIRIEKLREIGDSLIIEMPVFESSFRIKKNSKTEWTGKWIKNGSLKQQVMPFYAQAQSTLAPEEIPPAKTDITGRWALTFTQGDELSRPAIGEWQQKGYTLRGTILTPTGDYRYLTGVVIGDSLRLTTFDGAHAYLFTAKIENGHTISGGIFYSGATSSEPWTGVKDANATLPDVAAMYVKDPDEPLRFKFLDLNKKPVSLTDARFKNKVVIIQIMGSWCPNCMDETAFLSEFYNKNRQRGVEIIGLAYEYSTDFARSKKSIEKFRDRFNVKYTLLNTGVTVSDTLRTEKTLPQLTRIKSFPSTIFLNKQHRVARIHTGFEGPGTGVHYEELKKEFGELVDKLVGERQ